MHIADNNHCECEKCINKRPADLYVELLNRIDEALTERNIGTKIVFLIYVDLLWEPKETKLKNPGRFVLMFAPITRTYTESLSDAKPFDMKELTPYVKNKVIFPKNVSENLARLFKWQEHFKGDSFIFDYHYMWDHFLDPGYVEMAKILFKDMKNLNKFGINGMISCQNQRVFFPTGLGMSAMAEALWNRNSDFEAVSKKYFEEAFGTDGQSVFKYLLKLSKLFNPPYLRGECNVIDGKAAQNYKRISKTVNEFKCVIEDNLKNEELALTHKKSWIYLEKHGDFCKLLARTFEYTAQGKFNEADAAFKETLNYVRSMEEKLNNVFDVCIFYETFEKTIKLLKEKAFNQS